MEVERANDSDSVDALLRRWAETHRHQRTKDRRPYVIVLSYLPSQKGTSANPAGALWRLSRTQHGAGAPVVPVLRSRRLLS